MNAAAIPFSSPAGTAADGGRPTLLERQLAMLDELAQIAMEVARSVGRQAAETLAEGQAGAKGPDLTLAFSRAARAVRLTLLLQTRLVEGPTDRARGVLVSREARMARAQGHIERFVREEHGADRQAVERLSAEAAERLVEEEGFDELPMGQIVALICSDLQLASDRVQRALDLFDEEDERLPPPRSPAQGWDVRWLGAPPRPRRRPPPDDEVECGTGPPPARAGPLV